ncbi:hypothetical protein HDG40_006522 [Paraburkholderia sp. JPY158]|uniref:Uncharacterized protein n=1 Tax=Paraburkholderia atlantica TaxID=2654982 RepID=A0A7W8VA07_PARAM|nr:hypothetical protein [Paraburkholderia atlantica]MBB5428335.1 hypothetical protein [Paraburkholderia atlantica]
MANLKNATKNLELVNGPRHEDYRARIESALLRIKKRGVKFTIFGQLVDEVSGITKIHRTTITRNDTYNMLVTWHFLKYGGDLNSLVEDGAPREVLIALVRQLRVELLAARRDMKEMQSALSQKARSLSDSNPATRSEQSDEQCDYIDFANLGKLVLELVDRSEGTFEIDFKAGTFIDKVARPGNQKFGGAPQTRKFMKWAAGHKAYLETVQQLMKLARWERGGPNT